MNRRITHILTVRASLNKESFELNELITKIFTKDVSQKAISEFS